MVFQSHASSEVWPRLPLAEWQDTYATLHMYTQIIGKIRLALMPWINHCWQTTLYVTARGLTTSPIPYGTLLFQIDFDFIDHYLRIQTSVGSGHSLRLAPPLSVADFYWETMEALRSLGIDVSIWTTPQEVPNPIPFEQDQQHAAYDPEYVNRCWRILAQAARVFTEFRSRFIGKVSPVHFFWGSFDLAVTRFSGRPAPKHGSVPNLADAVVQDAYSHEVSSVGFWPGGGDVTDPVFYAYAYPAPEGFGQAAIQPKEAFYNTQMGEFFLPYEAVRTAASPDETLLAFLQTTYEAAADLGRWDRSALERR
ncbi:MAG TPA: DUF5996 family protein [Chthonomonadaceae bacterium]|nr:DUF5996 family protein [Chthonomonadaceae bacterium]